MPVVHTFKQRIEDIVGALSPADDDALDDWLTDTAREIADHIPMEKLIRNATIDVPDPSALNWVNAYDLKENKLLLVERDGRRCTETSAGMSNELGVDSGSIYEPEDNYPTYYISAGHVIVKPDPTITEKAQFTLFTYPTVGNGFTGIPSFPNEVEGLVVIGSALKCLMRMMTDKKGSVAAPSISSPFVISTPAPVHPSLSSSSISFSESAPTYVPPIISQTDFDTFWSASNLGDNDPGPILVTSSPPNAPTLSSSSVSFASTAPSYISPVSYPSFADLDSKITLGDVELASIEVQKIGSEISEYQSDIQNQLNAFNEANVEYQADLNVAIQDAQLSSSDDAQLLQKYSTETQLYQAQITKEVQEYGQKISRYQMELGSVVNTWQTEESNKLGKYQSDLQNNLNSFNEENVEYQANLQVAIQDAQLSSQDDAQKLQKYASEIGEYQARVQAEVQETGVEIQNFQAQLQLETTEYQWLQAQYTALRSEYIEGIKLLGGRSQQQ